ncbi:hypothetical protein GO491_00555 [Flavobacteriaceae bacterium Ap0902]|nr:hypothetical protein [Flavobacteriaceae bacterium Ap0902]
MKKLQFLMLGLFFMIASCTTSKVAKQTETGLRGDWTLRQIINDEGNTVVITSLLGNPNVACFEGSTWHFVANNNSGYYILNGAGCDSTEQPIKWYVEEDGANTYFWFKNLEEGLKAKEITTGYKMRVISVDNYQAHLVQEVPYDAGKLNIHYYFDKQ